MSGAAPAAPALLVFATLAPLLPLTGPAGCAAAGVFEALVARLAAAGYRGLEVQCSQLLLIGKARFLAALERHDLLFIAKIYSSGGPAAVPHATGAAPAAHPPAGASVAAHLAVWEASARECVEPPALRARLVALASQGGRDAFHRAGGAEADAFLARALAVAAELAVPVHHETHRHRVLFAPFLAVEAVRRFPALTLLADLSHYAVVCEAACGDAELEAAVAELVPHVRHIHARVGHEQAPQVADPRLPQWAAQLEGHARWWAAAFRAARARGDAAVTITPEFLPPPYCALGADGRPCADVDDVNAFMAGYVRELFARTMAEAEGGAA